MHFNFVVRPLFRLSGLIKILIFIILRTFCCQFNCQPVICQLVEPKAGLDRHGPCQGRPFPACLSGDCCLTSNFPAGIDKLFEVTLVFKDSDKPEFFYAHSETGLNLDHLHEGGLASRVIDR